MIHLQTITTLELSSKCQLKCKYCINRMFPDYAREYEIMDADTFDRSMYWLRELVYKGTQRELNLNGNGESLLDPELIERIRIIRNVAPDIPLGMSTNGLAMTQEIALQLRDLGVRVDVSIHKPEAARKAVDIMRQCGLQGGVINPAVISNSHNWAGQLEDEESVVFTPPGMACTPLIEGRGYILSNGDVTPCCYDFRSLGKFGSVFDDDLLQRPILPYSLCDNCHQTIPEPIKALAHWNNYSEEA